MKLKQLNRVFGAVLMIVYFNISPASSKPQWKTVRVGGGGFVTSMKAHPKVKNLYFISTDVGTPYRWNSTKQAWEGLFYDFPASGWDKYAAGDIAFDPSDATGNILYVTISGAGSIPGTVLKSTDRGNTWEDCKVSIEVWPNAHKGNNRLAVDPQNSNVVYVTTCSSASLTSLNGTFKSNKAGKAGSWVKTNNLYGNFVEFDASKGKIRGVTKNIYIGCADGVYQSNDGGKEFKKMSNSPEKPNRAALFKDGTLYITSCSGVYKWDGYVWKNITPPTNGNYSAIAVNPNNNLQLVCCSNSFNPYKFNAYRSNDGGASWTHMVTDSTIADLSEVPWYATTLGQNLTEFCWDPFNQNEVWFTDFFFASQTTDIWATPYPIWKPRAVGEEEIIPTGNLLCPPSGKNLLISNIADAGGWDHKSLAEPPVVGMQKFFAWKPDPGKSGGWGNMTGVAVQETNPDFIARVGRIGWNGSGYAGYSLDGGDTYIQFNIPQGVAGGRIAISATCETMVWLPQSGAPQRSIDRGKSWQPITSLPSGIIVGGENVFSTGPVFPLAADKVNGNKFYIYKSSGGMYVSHDGGITFALLGKYLPGTGNAKNLTVETTPGKEGDIWVGMIETGLFHSTNSGNSFAKINVVQKAEFISIGKASPDKPNNPIIYVFGTVNNIAKSLFRSNDNGLSWENLGSPAIGRAPLCMAADRQVYGRIFLGTEGNGFFYGEGF